MRQRIACGICAVQVWIEDGFPCHLWKECPADILDSAAAAASDDNSAGSDDSVEKGPSAAKRRNKPRYLCDETGYYIGDEATVNKLLAVENYIRDWPRIPREELHASSVQHPRHADYRWLLHTRRVCVLPLPSGDAELTHKPACAGIGDEAKPVWICRECRNNLCQREPTMPPFALANWNWGGRTHPT